MKEYILPKVQNLLCAIVLITSVISCTTEGTEETDEDPIVGKWFLTAVNGTNVSDVDCYKDSYIESDATDITFFIQDRLENGDCEIVLNNRRELTIQEDFYYLGDEAIEIYIDNNELSWRVNLDTTLEFRK